MSNELEKNVQVSFGHTKGEAFARLGILVHLPPLLESFGCDPGPVIQACGLRVKTFDDPRNRITYRSAGKLLAKSAAESGCEHFGLLLGQQHDLSYAGAAGFAAMSASTVGQALETICEFLVLSDEGGSLNMKRSGKVSRCQRVGA